MFLAKVVSKIAVASPTLPKYPTSDVVYHIRSSFRDISNKAPGHLISRALIKHDYLLSGPVSLTLLHAAKRGRPSGEQISLRPRSTRVPKAWQTAGYHRPPRKILDCFLSVGPSGSLRRPPKTPTANRCSGENPDYCNSKSGSAPREMVLPSPRTPSPSAAPWSHVPLTLR